MLVNIILIINTDKHVKEAKGPAITLKTIKNDTESMEKTRQKNHCQKTIPQA